MSKAYWVSVKSHFPEIALTSPLDNDESVASFRTDGRFEPLGAEGTGQRQPTDFLYGERELTVGRTFPERIAVERRRCDPHGGRLKTFRRTPVFPTRVTQVRVSSSCHSVRLFQLCTPVSGVSNWTTSWTMRTPGRTNRTRRTARLTFELHAVALSLSTIAKAW